MATASTGVLAAGAGASSTRSGLAQVRLEADVVVVMNEVRAEHRLAPLRLDPQLDAAAQQHTTQMVRLGYFAHTSANGSPFWRRIASFYPAGHFAEWAVGENLLWSPGSLDARRAVALWMASPVHRANILSPTWRQIGVSVRSVPHAPGVFDDLPVTVVTVDFGLRSD